MIPAIIVPFLFFTAEAFSVNRANDWTIPEVDRGYYNALCSVRQWTDGDTSNSCYYSRAREALMRTLGTRDARERQVQREIYRLIKDRMPEFYSVKVEKELFRGGEL